VGAASPGAPSKRRVHAAFAGERVRWLALTDPRRLALSTALGSIARYGAATGLTHPRTEKLRDLGYLPDEGE
jgi:hypothetical protein